GVVHRDVQPKNVLLGKDGSLKLANFSVAFDERMPTAPELLEGGSGYDGPDDRSTSLRIRRDPVPPLSKKAPGVSQALERLTQRCLEKMPSDRFDGALEACTILEAAAQELGAEPTAPLIRDTLIRARLIDGSPLKGAAERKRRPNESRVKITIAGLFVALLAVLGGGFAIQSLSGKAVGTAVAAQAGRRLELLPTGRAYLRVVAHPWAHVIVDGQEVEITPFARPI